ncbi:MAG: SDR family NAD(P)-dependent oxidoreductase [Longimicrobiaceae bacterium]
MNLEDKSALVTGAAVRVGRALALGLAGEGMKVVVHYGSSGREAEGVVAEIVERGGRAVAIQADLSVHAEVLRLASEAGAAFGGLDLLVNSAALFPVEGLAQVDEAVWDATQAVNLKAPFFLTQQIGRTMKERGGGAIINIGDLSGLQPWSSHAADAVSKAGLLHLTRVAARALAPEVRVNAVVPGTVLPPAGTPDRAVRRLAKRAALQRVGTPEDVVAAVLYLARAGFVTGQLLCVDGGRWL